MAWLTLELAQSETVATPKLAFATDGRTQLLLEVIKTYPLAQLEQAEALVPIQAIQGKEQPIQIELVAKKYPEKQLKQWDEFVCWQVAQLLIDEHARHYLDEESK